MKRLPIAQTVFKDIIEENYLYVDKTMYIKKLVDAGHTYFFLSRPRRFGKSLFLDTLSEAFLGNKKLFKGLYLEKNWNWNDKYPVIKISFGAGSAFTKEELYAGLNYSLKVNANNYNIVLEEKYVTQRFAELIEKLRQKTEKKVVVLIDEYDKPILDNITKPIADAMREELASFYSLSKSHKSMFYCFYFNGRSA